MKKIFSFLLCSVMALAASATTFTKVTTAPDDWSGNYIVVCEDTVGNGAKVFTCVDASQNFVTTTVSNDSIVADNLSSYIITIETMEGGYAVKVGNQYIGGDASNNTIKFANNPILNTLLKDPDGVRMTSNQSVLRFNPKSTTTNGKETGIRFRYYKVASYTNHMPIQLYRTDEEIVPPTVDTIGVTEALARINAGQLGACYVKGVVATKPSDPGTYGNTIFWMTDIENTTDSIEGYKIRGLNDEAIATKADIPFAMGDTILVYATKLELYTDKNIYEINGGYLAEILGKAPYQILPFTYGDAIYHGQMPDAWEFSLVLRAQEDSLPMIDLRFNSRNEHGIAGRYSTFHAAVYTDENGEPLSADNVSLSLTYAGVSATDYNLYDIELVFSADSALYRYDGQLEIAGYTEDYADIYSLSDDRPFIPKAGDTITCAQAREYALSLPESNVPTEFEVTIIGYVTKTDGAVSRNQQIFWIDDQKGTAETFQAYYCNVPNGAAVPVGAKVAITGKIMRYNTTPEMKNGNTTIIEGGDTPERELNILPVPDDAITVAEALAIGNALDSISEETYTVVGYIAKVAYQTANDTASWYMTDEKVDGTGRYDFEAYKCAIDNLILVGDFVFVSGQITKYVGSYTTIEIKYGEAHFANAPSAIENVTAQPATLDLNQPMYNTLGQPVDATFRGIVIQNGHKYLLY